MSEIKFKTEWLDQLRRLSKCGREEDIDCFYDRLLHYVKTGEKVPGTDLAEMVLAPIIAEMEQEKAKHDKRVAAGKARWSSNAQAMVEQCSSNAQAEKEIKEKEKKQKKENTEKEYITDASVDNTNVLSPSLSCSEPKKSASEPADPPLISFLCTKGQEFGVTQEFYEQLCEAYPAVNAMEQLKKIKSWCFANPKLRKTKGGAMRFVNNWFAKEQDRAAPPNARSGTIGQRRLTAEEVAALPAIDPFAELRGG